VRIPVAVLVFGLPVAVLAQTSPCPTRSTVSVSGSSTVRLRPDRVSFTVGVETDAPSVAQSFQQNNGKLNAVVNALKKNGVAPNEIQTSNFYLASRDEEGKKLSGYRVSNSVTVVREGTSDVSGLLQAAVDAGATEAGNVRFFVADPKKSQMRGIELAFQDARAKAEKLAALSGRSLGEVVSVSDQSYGGGFLPPPPAPPP